MTLHTFISKTTAICLIFGSVAVAQTTGDYQTAQTGTWNDVATWARWNGSQWITPAPSTPASTDGAVQLLSGHTITVTNADSIDQLTIASGAKLVIADTASLKIQNGAGDDLTLNDSLIVYGSVTAQDTALVRVMSGGVYVHAREGGSVPDATWETGATLMVTGTISNPPSGLNQDLYNFVWDCAGQLGNQDWSWAYNTIHGNITVRKTGPYDRVRMTSPGATPEGPNTITIMGDIIVEGGSFESNGSSSQDTITINHHGNVISTTDGVFSASRGSGPTVYWNAYGDFTITGSTVQISGGPKANYYFVKQGVQTLTFSNVTFGGGGFPMVIRSGSTVKVGSIEFTGWTTFSIDSAATIATTHPNGLDGNLQIGNTKTFHPDADYIFEGTAAQRTGSLLPVEVSSIEVKNPAGVTLSHNVNVRTALRLTSGHLLTGAHTITAASIQNGSTTSYVNTAGGGYLQLKNVGASETFFPVGTDQYAPAWLTNHGTADDFSVGVIHDDSTSPRFGRVMNKWTINEGTAGGSVTTLKLGWMAASENSRFAENRAADARILRVGTDTVEVGRGAYRRQSGSEPYTVERDSIISFSSFVIGAIGPYTAVPTETMSIPSAFSVDQNYPNPFNPSTSITYHIPGASLVTVRVHDALGRTVADLVNKEHEPGSYTVNWDASGHSSGMYYCTVTSGEEMKLLKLVLLK